MAALPFEDSLALWQVKVTQGVARQSPIEQARNGQLADPFRGDEFDELAHVWEDPPLANKSYSPPDGSRAPRSGSTAISPSSAATAFGMRTPVLPFENLLALWQDEIGQDFAPQNPIARARHGPLADQEQGG